MNVLDGNLDAGSHGHEASHAHGTRGSYLVGFGLSAVLTSVAFWLVMSGTLSDARAAALAVVILAFVQIIVHTLCFLHVNTRVEGGWTLMALMFAVVIITIVISGSMWIMYHLNSNMMPMAPGSMRGMP